MDEKEINHSLDNYNWLNEMYDRLDSDPGLIEESRMADEIREADMDFDVQSLYEEAKAYVEANPDAPVFTYDEDGNAMLNEEYIDSRFEMLTESTPPSNVAGNATDGAETIGASAGSANPPQDKRDEIKEAIIPDEMFAGNPVFNVPSGVYGKFRQGKHPRHRWEKYLDESTACKKLKEYCQSNPGKRVLVKDQSTGGMMYVKSPMSA